MPLAEVQVLHPYHDIVAMLRKAADDIEKGEYGDVVDGVFILEKRSGMQVFSWGPSDFKRSLGLIELGRQHMFEIWRQAEEVCQQ